MEKLQGWIAGAPHRWPAKRIVVAMAAIVVGDAQWQSLAAGVPQNPALRPQPMSSAQVADLVRRTREADARAEAERVGAPARHNRRGAGGRFLPRSS